MLNLGTDSTEYFFKIESGFLEPGLDRFAQFFMPPLLRRYLKDGVLKEVDSEHNKNLQSDVFRLDQLRRSLSNPEYPYNRFWLGNNASLHEHPSSKGLDLHQALIEFERTYYSANLMKLVVLGREPLDELEQWVVDKFAAVENKNTEAPNFDGRPLTAGEFQVKSPRVPDSDNRWK